MKTELIKNIKLPKIANKHPVAFWSAIALHVILVIGLVFSSVQRWEIPKTVPKSSAHSVPKAVTVDLSEIKKEKQRLITIKQNREKRLADLKRAEKRVENERYKEQQRLKKLKAKTKKEQQAKAKAEKSRKAAEKKNKQALKKKKLAEKKALEAEKRKKIAENKAKAAEQEKQKIEQLRAAEANKFEKEQDTRSLKKEIQAEEDQEREIAQEDILSELKANYVNQIAARVKEKWRYQGAQDDWGCDVYILQDLNGNVQSVNLQSCNVSNSAKAKVFKDAIERAVYKASPLPHAPDKSVFDREVLFHFRVN
ncbi:TonB C-terminal domain-containing protein [Candidatus Thioglobus autotrophicus]|uniref:TonB C-terminal domain-containing protein n=1 Tax=Candidatus Thioglobus autotrophicus TaxID=1705394 RepID=UPI00299E88D6|nr:TonB C-terminal domain-containing protein [Candidatus Thioglobus autotrophicus]WPE16946.1 TonB C-terminal domain-containing protein [Candidatus Thioglobus autotrophicus]